MLAAGESIEDKMMEFDRRSFLKAGGLAALAGSPGTRQSSHLGPALCRDDVSRASPFPARRLAQLLSASGVIVRSAIESKHYGLKRTRPSEPASVRKAGPVGPAGSQCRSPDFMHPHPLAMQKNAMATINTMQIAIPIAGTNPESGSPPHNSSPPFVFERIDGIQPRTDTGDDFGSQTSSFLASRESGTVRGVRLVEFDGPDASGSSLCRG